MLNPAGSSVDTTAASFRSQDKRDEPQATRGTRRGATYCPRGSVFLVVALVSAVIGCDGSVVHAVSLGTLPAGVRIPLTQNIGSLGFEARLSRIKSSCGCLNASLLAGGASIKTGDLIPANQDLTVMLELIPQATGDIAEEAQVELVRAADDRVRLRKIQISAHLSPHHSVFETSAPIAETLMLPEPVRTVTVQLRRPATANSVHVSDPTWMEASEIAESHIRISLRPPNHTGRHAGFIEVESRAGVFERRHIHLTVTARQTLSPDRLIARMDCGSSLRTAVAVAAPEGKSAPRLRIPSESIPRADSSFGMTVTPGEAAAPLSVEIHAGATPGVYKGALFVAPHQEAAYELTLPYYIVVR